MRRSKFPKWELANGIRVMGEACGDAWRLGVRGLPEVINALYTKSIICQEAFHKWRVYYEMRKRVRDRDAKVVGKPCDLACKLTLNPPRG